MAKEDLINFKERTPLERVALGRIGGKSRSVAKSEGAKLRHIKARMAKEGLTEEDSKWVFDCLNERKSYAAQLMIHAQKIKNDVHPSQRIALLNTEAKIGEFIHGTQVKTENLNLNVNTTADEWNRRMNELKRRKENV